MPRWWRERWGRLSAQQILDSRRSLTGYFELMKNYRVQGSAQWQRENRN